MSKNGRVDVRAVCVHENVVDVDLDTGRTQREEGLDHHGLVDGGSVAQPTWNAKPLEEPLCRDESGLLHRGR